MRLLQQWSEGWSQGGFDLPVPGIWAPRTLMAAVCVAAEPGKCGAAAVGVLLAPSLAGARHGGRCSGGVGGRGRRRDRWRGRRLAVDWRSGAAAQPEVPNLLSMLHNSGTALPCSRDLVTSISCLQLGSADSNAAGQHETGARCVKFVFCCRVMAQMRRLLSRDCLRLLSRDCLRLRAFGGSRFSTTQAPAPEWEAFGSFYFMLPRFARPQAVLAVD
jgi:hypothetical protein